MVRTLTPQGKGQSTLDNKLQVQVIDLFSGCGGMSVGFKTAETDHVAYEVLGGLDVDRYANETYRRMIGRPAIEADIRSLATEDGLEAALREWGYDPRKPLVLIGCAPCQGFSSHRKKDRRVDDRNELLLAFGEVAAMLSPELVIMENVPEILHSAHWRHYAAFSDRMKMEGYKTRARIHNLASFAVPQERYRAVVLSSRTPGLTEMPSPTRRPSEFTTVRQAIGDLPELIAGERCSEDEMHITSRHRESTLQLLKMIPKDGGSRSSLPAGVGPDCHTRVDGFRDVYGRLWWDRPAVAITARCRTPSCGRFVHPSQDRGLSVREAALLQGFPKDFYFCGPFDDKYKQIGNAVAPIFSKSLAQHVDLCWAGLAPATDEADDVRSPIQKSFSSAIAGMKRKMRIDEKATEAAA